MTCFSIAGFHMTTKTQNLNFTFYEYVSKVCFRNQYRKKFQIILIFGYRVMKVDFVSRNVDTCINIILSEVVLKLGFTLPIVQ